jgi:hypothetical protein
MVKLWDIFNPKQPRSKEELYTHRLDICDDMSRIYTINTAM